VKKSNKILQKIPPIQESSVNGEKIELAEDSTNPPFRKSSVKREEIKKDSLKDSTKSRILCEW
jgi:hypothetical protein